MAQGFSSAIEAKILKSPSLQQVQMAAEWLFHHPDPNPDLEVALNHVLTGRIVPNNTGELLAIAHTAPNSNLSNPKHIRGILMASPDNRNVSLLGCDRVTAEAFLSLVQEQGHPKRVAMSIPTCDWLRPLLLRNYQLTREHNCLVMICTEAPADSDGRWATPQDKPTLQAYIEADQAERGGRKVKHNWDALIQQKRVAVLEHNGQIVSIMQRGATAYQGMVTGAFTFAPFRRQGFAKQLLAFLICELLQEYATVKLWVREDNLGAILLYQSLGFQQIGAFYTSYFESQV